MQPTLARLPEEWLGPVGGLKVIALVFRGGRPLAETNLEQSGAHWPDRACRTPRPTFDPSVLSDAPIFPISSSS